MNKHFEFARNLACLDTAPSASVVTLGGFDGLHRGHQAMLKALQTCAQALGLPAWVVTFEPLPREYFAAGDAPPRLMSLREKLNGLRQLGVEQVLCLPFNAQLANLTAEDFIQQTLVEKLGARHILVGDDFRFGYHRQGDFTLLASRGRQLGFDVSTLPPLKDNDMRISSTRIRAALAQGDMVTTENMLGRPYSMCGRVQRGAARGRALGFPTANLHIKRRQTPLQGVFAVHARLEQHWLPAVANIGVRPTFDGERCLLEVHLFDFAESIYDKTMEVRFLHKLREERRFDSVDKLVATIHKDCQQARDFFARKV